MWVCQLGQTCTGMARPTGDGFWKNVLVTETSEVFPPEAMVNDRDLGCPAILMRPNQLETN